MRGWYHLTLQRWFAAYTAYPELGLRYSHGVESSESGTSWLVPGHKSGHASLGVFNIIFSLPTRRFASILPMSVASYYGPASRSLRNVFVDRYVLPGVPCGLSDQGPLVLTSVQEPPRNAFDAVSPNIPRHLGRVLFQLCKRTKEEIISTCKSDKA